MTQLVERQLSPLARRAGRRHLMPTLDVRDSRIVEWMSFERDVRELLHVETLPIKEMTFVINP